MFEFLKKKPDNPLPEEDFKDFVEPKTLSVEKPTGSYSNVPKMWGWLLKLEGLPLMVSEGLKEYGTLETPGSLNNKKIIAWADEVAKCHSTKYTNWAADWYNRDSIAWCGLFAAVIACRAAYGKTDRLPPTSYLSALAWTSFANTVDWKNNLNNIWMGDIAVFVREGGGHVGIVIGLTQDKKYIVLLAGNQSDAVNIKMISTSRLYSVRRPQYRNRPISAKHFVINSNGVNLSTNEA